MLGVRVTKLLSTEDRLFTVHEVSSTLTIQKFPKLGFNATAPLIANVSIIPKDLRWVRNGLEQKKRNIASDPSSLGPRGDSTAIFEYVRKGTQREGLRLVRQVFTGLNQIRGMIMMIGLEENGSESYLIAAGVAGSAGTIVLERVDGGADLKVVARNTEIPTRTAFLWLQQVTY
ncbi:hypothetical protein E1B28_007599 [Marasmius oreades]|uniref:Uncharacterized protein n=1 Tax=Marasmius oreades TaxID=181124 RepID=A0A9P7S1V6_9AGAR|nr:uncharacterized protein E1B28_007599 [Marasmius oreades]KAG7093969.1 hypothetical protein E1B28_007599 [Marasmius oreades]